MGSNTLIVWTKGGNMFTRDEALALWDDLQTDKDSFLHAFGELVLTRTPNFLPRPTHDINDPKNFGYFVHAKNGCFTVEMLNGYARVCAKHNCKYRIEIHGQNIGIIFYKDKK
jgi:hypothetical protein